MATQLRVLSGFLLLTATSVALHAAEAPSRQQLAEQLVQSALESERLGNEDRRETAIREALELASDLPAANWHAARLQIDERWVPLEQAQQSAAQDETLYKYRELREKAGDDPQALESLARWCARVGLPERAEAHYGQLLLNPQTDNTTRNEALNKLGLKDVGGVFLTEEQIRERNQTAEQIKQSIRSWRPKLLAWQKPIQRGGGAKAEFAVKQMQEVDDHEIIPALATFLSESGDEFGTEIVHLLGKFDVHDATVVLTQYSVAAPTQAVREAAIQQLRSRPLHDFVPLLMGELVAPLRSKWQIREDADGNLHYQHLFFREGAAQNQLLALGHIAVAQRMIVRGQRVTGRPGPARFGEFQGFEDVQETGERQLEALELLSNVARRESALQHQNALIQARNYFIFHALEETTGVLLPREANDWWLWWESYNESTKPRPVRYVYRQTYSTFAPTTGVANYAWVRHSCFAVDTLVWTETGLTPIQDVRIGDRVVSQNPETGELALKLVVNTTVGRPTSGLAKLHIGDEEILSTLGHVFWVNGNGWRIAKQLHAENRLHSLRGGLRLYATEEMPAPAQVFNLVVEDFHTYFVGECGLLAHDITYRQPTTALVPGLGRED